MLHQIVALEDLANLLIKSITSNPAEIFSLNSGEIEVGKGADFAYVTLPAKVNNLKSIALQTILHINKVDEVWITGKKVL